ncbi:MAG: hypothetical protein ACLQHK_07515 [Gallionellaceae bacterium]
MGSGADGLSKIEIPARNVPAWQLLAVLACYFNSLSGAFQFDDYNVIVDNPRVHSWDAWLAGLSHGIRPLLKFSYTLDWTLGLGAAGFHLTNLLIHLGNAYLVYLLAGKFVRRRSNASDCETCHCSLRYCSPCTPSTPKR